METPAKCLRLALCVVLLPLRGPSILAPRLTIVAILSKACAVVSLCLWCQYHSTGQNQGYPQNGKRCDNRWHWGPESGSLGPLYLAHLSPLSYHSTHESAKVTAKIVMTAVTKDERWPCRLQEFPQDLSDEEVPQLLSHLPLSRQRPRGHANMIRQQRSRS